MKPTVWCQEGDANGRGIGGMLFWLTWAWRKSLSLSKYCRETDTSTEKIRSVRYIKINNDACKAVFGLFSKKNSHFQLS